LALQKKAKPEKTDAESTLVTKQKEKKEKVAKTKETKPKKAKKETNATVSAIEQAATGEEVARFLHGVEGEGHASAALAHGTTPLAAFRHGLSEGVTWSSLHLSFFFFSGDAPRRPDATQGLRGRAGEDWQDSAGRQAVGRLQDRTPPPTPITGVCVVSDLCTLTIVFLCCSYVAR
jgi:hypothetical protein